MKFFERVLNKIRVMEENHICVEHAAGLAKACDCHTAAIEHMVEQGYIAINWQGRPYLLVAREEQIPHVAGKIHKHQLSEVA